MKPLVKGEIQRAAASAEAAHAVVSTMPDPERSLLLWFSKLLARVAANEPVNKMSPSNLAIVVSPVLADLPLENPFIALELTRHATLFIKQLIAYQLAHL
jgi:RhoGAP domain